MDTFFWEVEEKTNRDKIIKLGKELVDTQRILENNARRSNDLLTQKKARERKATERWEEIRARRNARQLQQQSPQPQPQPQPVTRKTRRVERVKRSNGSFKDPRKMVTIGIARPKGPPTNNENPAKRRTKVNTVKNNSKKASGDA